jgi:hypothetical protein
MTSDLIFRLNTLRGASDPLADAVVQALDSSHGDLPMLLDAGMRKGVAAIKNAPDSLEAFLRDAEAALSSTCPLAIARAAEQYLLIGPLWMSVSLGPGSLVHTYSDPAIAAILTRTGKLSAAGAARRLQETQRWNLGIVRPGGLVLGGAGYIQTLQVRLLHARIRARLSQTSMGGAAGAPPIDQWQMVRTWLDFTVVAFRALERIGFALGDKDSADLYALWHLVGRLLGIDERVLELVANQSSAQAVLLYIDRNTATPDQNAIELTRAMLDALGARLGLIMKLPEEVAVLLAESYCRLFHGDSVADELRVPANWTQCLLPIQADANRYRLLRAQQDHAFRSSLIEQSLKACEAIDASFSGKAAYE